MTTVFVPTVRVNADAQHAAAPSWVATLAQGVHAWFKRIADTAQPHEPRTPEELLEWARQYEETQPSYAADLRAAAWYAQAQTEAQAQVQAQARR